MKTFEFYWDDLTPECQERLYEFLDGENGNYDVIPFATLEIEEECHLAGYGGTADAREQ